MKKGINKIYGFMLENLVNKDVNMSIKELKYISDLVYNWIMFHEEDVEVIINEHKKISTKNIKK